MYRQKLERNLKEYLKYNKTNLDISKTFNKLKEGKVSVLEFVEDVKRMGVSISLNVVLNNIEDNLANRNVDISKIINLKEITIFDIERIAEQLKVSAFEIYPFEEFEINHLELKDLNENYKGPVFDVNYLTEKFDLNNWLMNGACTEVKKGYIVDGDTIAVSYNKELIRVRMLVIDTPEIYKKNDKWSIKAREYTRELINESDNIYLQLDNKSEVRDKYGRVLAWVWIHQNGEMKLLNSILVQVGLASIRYVMHKDSFYIDKLRELESISKKEKKVMWDSKNIDPNWDYENDTHKVLRYKIKTNKGYVRVSNYELTKVSFDETGTFFRTKEDCEFITKKINIKFEIIEVY